MTGVYEQIQEKFILKNAWNDWQDYRHELTSLVNEYAGGKLAVVGAGRCNDIDLSMLDFDYIELIDVNAGAMRDAIERLPKDVRGKVSVRELSLTGITEADLELFCERILGYTRSKGMELSKDAYETCLNSELDTLEEKLFDAEKTLSAALPEGAYDVVLCSGVCSQLFTMISFFIRSISQSVAAQLFPEAVMIGEKAEQRLRGMNDRAVPLIDRAIISASKKAAVFGNEDPPCDRVEGAYQSIRYLRDNYKTIERSLQWDFNPANRVRYRMTVQIVLGKSCDLVRDRIAT
ncbi:MAG: hypothetical protein IKO61_02275 [Lachnospiraceae bacterium]|nr:hypothetical protein [Lachnospiraceae bacterium]